ncbi:MAG: hypothetical protein IBX55_17865 [Methyloprofundus sp.]|nr:hypothetical protein [Methyloprofundus sp.]
MKELKSAFKKAFYINDQVRKSNGFLIIAGSYTLTYMLLILLGATFDATGFKLLGMIWVLCGLPWAFLRSLENKKSKIQNNL